MDLVSLAPLKLEPGRIWRRCPQHDFSSIPPCLPVEVCGRRIVAWSGVALVRVAQPGGESSSLGGYLAIEFQPTQYFSTLGYRRSPYLSPQTLLANGHETGARCRWFNGALCAPGQRPPIKARLSSSAKWVTRPQVIATPGNAAAAPGNGQGLRVVSRGL